MDMRFPTLDRATAAPAALPDFDALIAILRATQAIGRTALAATAAPRAAAPIDLVTAIKLLFGSADEWRTGADGLAGSFHPQVAAALSERGSAR